MSCTQFHCIKMFILRHAWLNLWDKHMTTGRINQVTTIKWDDRRTTNSYTAYAVKHDWHHVFALPSTHSRYRPRSRQCEFITDNFNMDFFRSFHQLTYKIKHSTILRNNLSHANYRQKEAYRSESVSPSQKAGLLRNKPKPQYPHHALLESQRF